MKKYLVMAGNGLVTGTGEYRQLVDTLDDAHDVSGSLIARYDWVAVLDEYGNTVDAIGCTFNLKPTVFRGIRQL
jgi:hypothetical protein